MYAAVSTGRLGQHAAAIHDMPVEVAPVNGRVEHYATNRDIADNHNTQGGT